jgi:hypothetical protein
MSPKIGGSDTERRSNPLKRLDVPDRANPWEATRVFCCDVELRIERMAALHARILVLRMQGYTARAIAGRVARSERQVLRILDGFTTEEREVTNGES